MIFISWILLLRVHRMLTTRNRLQNNMTLRSPALRARLNIARSSQEPRVHTSLPVGGRALADPAVSNAQPLFCERRQ